MQYRRMIFLHIQKTAGTTAVVHLKRVLKPRTMLKLEQFAAVPAARLPDYEFISGHFGFAYIKDVIDTSYSITFMREPVQRVLSLYSYCRATPLTERTRAFPIFASARRMSIDEFVRCEDPASGIPQSIDNTQTWQLAKDYSALARYSGPPPSDEALHDLAVRNLERFSHVGFQEDFLRHLQCILPELGFAAPRSTGRVNYSPCPMSQQELQPRTLDALRERLRLDSALYQYARAEYGLPQSDSIVQET